MNPVSLLIWTFMQLVDHVKVNMKIVLRTWFPWYIGLYHCGITKPTYLENVIAVCVEYHNALVEVVVLHGTRAVKNSQGRFSLSLEGIIRAPMVQVVTEAGHEQP